MEKRTLLALVALVLLAGGALVVLRAPEKGQRKGPPPRPIPEIKAADLTHLEVTNDKQQKTVLEKSGSDWRVKAPGDWKADQSAVKGLTDGLEKLTFADTASETADKHAELGVADGKGAHIVAQAGGKTVADLYVGKSVSSYTMIRVAGKNETWQGSGLFPYAVNREPSGWRDHTVFDFPAADADKLTVETGGQKLVLEKEAAAKDAKPGDQPKWKVASSEGAGPKTTDALDQAQATGAVQALASLHAADFADDKKPEEVKGAAGALTVTAEVKGKPHTLYVGGEKGDDIFIASSDSPTVYTVKKFALERVGRKPIDYRDKTLTKVKDAELSGLDITSGGETTALVAKDGQWKTAKGTADDTKVKPVVASFDNLQASGFSEEKDAAKTGLAKPAGQAVLHLKNKSTVTLKIGAATKDGTDYYVQKVGAPDVYLVKKYAVDRFLKKPADLIKK
jgi:hypothetical protein